jgi:Signal transduction histidine kinase
MDVLNNILDLSKIESGEMVFEKEPFDMEEVVRSLMQSTHFQAKGKPVSVDFYVDGRINQLLLGDKAKLTQVLSNLLSNSIKFTKKGFINCEVKVKKETPHKFLLQIEINDSGIGIPEEKVKDVFDNLSKLTKRYAENMAVQG